MKLTEANICQHLSILIPKIFRYTRLTFCVKNKNVTVTSAVTSAVSNYVLLLDDR